MAWLGSENQGTAAQSAARARQEEAARSIDEPREFTNNTGMEMVLIPTGEFEMGSNGGRDTETPVHIVKITEPFYIGATEVTQAQYQAVMGTNPSAFKDDDSRPVESVSWDDAVAFCEKLSAREKQTYRLPTEAEWEYACRADSTTAYCFGDDESRLGRYAWYYGNATRMVVSDKAWRHGGTHPVAQKKPNDWGLYDMHGNIWEWCEDAWHDSYAGAPVDGSAWLAGSQQWGRVLRGGAFFSYPENVRCACRHSYNPSYQASYVGFRVVSPLAPDAGTPGSE